MEESSDARIDQLRVRAVRVPMQPPHRTASGLIGESPLVLTDVVLEDGSAGHSITFAYTPAALNATAELIRNLEPLVQGELPAPVSIEQNLARRFRLLGTQGLVGMALAAVDMALWDLLARRQGISLACLLGAEEKPLRAYGGVGYDGELGSAKAAEEWAARGFKGVKAKIGYATAEEDLAVVRAMRSAVGPETAIMVDYNQSLTPAEAVQRMRVLDGEGLTWVEEPTLAHDFEGHAMVAAQAETPIQCGENWWGPLDLQHAIDARASDYVMLDVMKIGGVTGWMRASGIAHAHNLPTSSHLWPEVSAQLLPATPGSHWLEYTDWWNAVILNPLVVRDGMTGISGVIGSGVEWNESAIASLLD